MKHTSLIMGIGSVIAGVQALRDAFSDDKSLGEALPKIGKKSKYKAKIYNVGSIDSRIKHILGLIDKGRRDPNVRAFAAKAVSKKCGDKFCIQERDYWGEVKAVFGEIRKSVRYVRDGHRIDTFQAAKRTLEFGAGDCFPVDTIVRRDDGDPQISEVRVGDRLHDGERFVMVLKTWDRGLKPIHCVGLGNGARLRLSDTHKVLRVVDGATEECCVHELRIGDQLLQPLGEKTAVRSLFLEPVEQACVDIMTESGRVLIPSCNVIVRQCDDYTITMGAALQSIGFPVRLRVIRTTGSKDWNHIFLLVGLPPKSPSKWVALDASVDKPAGWHPPQGMITKVKDFDVR